MSKFNPLGLSPELIPNFDHMEQDLDALKEICSKVFLRGLAVEVGTWVGRSALVLENYFDKVYCVDTWDGRTAHWYRLPTGANVETDLIYKTFCRNIGDGLYKTIIPIRSESVFAASCFNYDVDFIFIDGGHEYEDIHSDILAWKPHLKDGGIMAFHDYGWWPGVTKAVDELCPGAIKSGFSMACWKK